ncbi:FAD/NAD(P)-binding protein [Aetokthonos hydrillicola Thurmond2011]|jgi:hypothetical protein|uniref:AetF n=1 Tax=Aetokthonos hydrillicola Thurmond2011 TaxID=2712845 RepID=A0A861B9Z9_9CYAN|nr:thioredoxin reductase [Aetokthonos hydrillicola]MBO3460486.1 thioredoxin reductase [Aetokthonos hydrillicola CCALA 1050]MBW4588225.1 FAD/NAD(P)-binding protein [Aetokthonos hydrillicola CCALA 1050]MDR9893089.1 FAD/NAD(P)-binding protein [Aetokthonos hydrillicola Thurmond2011]QNL15176.1 AetF [Aetokthonos hydrillicola Thurmond2011]
MLEVCIIGFGFSAIPLVRELARTQTEFQIISAESGSVWDRLSESGRLDFSLVSSFQTSFYSFDLVRDYEKDYYPTAKQFYEMHERWRSVYEEKIIRDFVTKIENFKDYSLISTRSGKTYEAKHVVLATGFDRLMNTFLSNFDNHVSNKTFVFDTMGDSANLLIAKLIPNNNKIILRTNGFTALDQEVQVLGKPFTLDQLESPNFRYVSSELYDRLMMSPVYPRTVNPAVSYNQFPLIRRDFSWVDSKSSPPNGLIAIKYWPIDQYYYHFNDDLENYISKGYLLNDIAMWLHTGKVILVPSDTPINFDKKTITYAGIERSFHQYVKGDAEQPRLPTILINGETPFEYLYRDTFMGVIPQRLNNIYFLGYTRPFTGGLANITEMQSLFIHKLITQPQFHQKIHQNLSKRITAYNQHYYGAAKPRKHDHTVPFGFYTEDIARLIGIHYQPNECRSVRDLLFYYAFPNNAFKYRLKGEYAVDGVDELIQKVNDKHDHYAQVFVQALSIRNMNSDEAAEWDHSARRFSFNDMRHKEGYRAFLDTYLKAYRQVENISVDDTVVDEEWNFMVKEACQVRDKVAPNIEEKTHYSKDEDVNKGIRLILSILDSDISSLPDSNGSRGSGNLKEGDRLCKFEAQSIEFIRRLLQPKNYELLFIRESTVSPGSHRHGETA